MKAHYYKILVEGDLTIQENVMIEKSALIEVVRYFGIHNIDPICKVSIKIPDLGLVPIVE